MPVCIIIIFVSVQRHSAGGTYVRMSSEARAETTWIELPSPTTHPQTVQFNEKVMLFACSVLRQIIAGVWESGRGNSKNKHTKSPPESTGGKHGK